MNVGVGYIALRFGLAAHPLVTEVTALSGGDRALVVAVLIEVIEAALRAEDRGNVADFDAEGMAQTFGVETADILFVLDALRVVGIVESRLGHRYADLHRQGDDQDGEAEDPAG
jgi:hypothetical protein